MSIKTSLSLFATALLLAAPVAAERIFVAGPDGVVLRADTAIGDFKFFARAQNMGSITSLAATKDRLFVLDQVGKLRAFALKDGSFVFAATLPVPGAKALATDATSLFVGTDQSLVLRIDTTTGAILETRTTPAGVRSLFALDGMLFASTEDGAIYRAPTENGEFSYFACFCFGAIQGLGYDGEALLAGDAFGIVARVHPVDGTVLGAIWAAPMNTLATLQGDMLFHAGAGSIQRVDPVTGIFESPDSYYLAPVEVSAMLVIADEPQPRIKPFLTLPASLAKP